MNINKIINPICMKPQNLLNNIPNVSRTSNIAELKMFEKFSNPVKTSIGQISVLSPRQGVSFAEILGYVQKHPEEAFRRVDKMADGHHILYEGRTVDIDELGRLLSKKLLTNKSHIDKSILVGKPMPSKLQNRFNA